MLKTIIRRVGGWLCFLFIALAVQAQQYTVTGGQGTPLLAKDDTRNDLKVYLTDGMSNVSISYTSPSARHQWYRYKEKALAPEPVASEQNGNTSIIRNVEEGYGYFVDETDIMKKYVWIIDYNKYAFEVQSLSVKGDCGSIWLEGTPEIGKLWYYTPSGVKTELKREFEIAYQTLEWSKDSKMFVPKSVTATVNNPYSETIDDAPLCDTEVTLRGDLFARHFGIEKSMTTDLYQAVAIRLEVDTTMIMDSPLNMTAGEDGKLSAPAEIQFRAYANDPVAALYRWKIYRSDVPDGSKNPLVQFNGAEVSYTFIEAGTYTAEVEVSDRTGKCSDVRSVEDITITESFLDIPNAFSPGTTPGINDEFRVAYKSLVNYKIWIFNRWGVQLYHSTNPAVGWDGKKGGKYVPPGVYFYVIEATGSDGLKYNKKGSINILRPKTIDDEVHEQ